MPLQDDRTGARLTADGCRQDVVALETVLKVGAAVVPFPVQVDRDPTEHRDDIAIGHVRDNAIWFAHLIKQHRGAFGQFTQFPDIGIGLKVPFIAQIAPPNGVRIDVNGRGFVRPAPIGVAGDGLKD